MTERVAFLLLFNILLHIVLPLSSTACGDLNTSLSSFNATDFDNKPSLDTVVLDILTSPDYSTCKDYGLKGDLMYAIGLKYYNLHTKESYAAAESPFKTALAYRLDSLQLNNYDDEVIKCKINLGRCLAKSYQYGKSRAILESAYSVKDKLDNKKTVGRLLYHLGEIYQEMGIYDRAIHCFQEVIDLAESGVSSLIAYQVNAYNNLGISFNENGDFQASINSFYTYGNEFLAKDDPEFINFLLNFSYGLNELSLYDSSIVVLNQLEYQLLHQFSPDEVDPEWYNFYLNNCYLAQARSYTNLNMIDEAKSRIQLAAPFKDLKPIGYNDNLADIYLAENNIDSAIYYYHKAIWNGFDVNNISVTVADLPNLDNRIPKQSELMALLEVLNSYATACFMKFNQQHEAVYLNIAYQAYQIYDQLFVKNFERLLTDDSRYRLIKEARPAFENAMAVIYSLYESSKENNIEFVEQIFHFSERIRANLLFTSLSQKDALMQSLIPDSEKTELENLQVQIRLLDELLLNSSDRSEQENLRKGIENIKIHMDIAKAELAEKYPAYHNLAFNNHQLPTFKTIRSSVIKGDKAIVEYFTTNDYIYVIGINKRQSYLHRIVKTDQIMDNLQVFLQSISDWDYISTEKKKALTAYFENGNFLYNLLLKDVLTSLNKKEGDLVIIPDGKLNYVPFATLLSAPATMLIDAPFLVNQYNISYDYSAKSLLRNTVNNKSNKVEEICVFAPTYDNITEWAELKYNLMEIDLIRSIFKKILSFKGDQANKSNFESNCSACDILHIASHGSLDEENALKNHLVFYAENGDLTNAELTVSRLHLFSLQSKLTVLSSCNTAMGTQRSNEGLTSVSNAFSYAGSQSVMASLWLLNDKQAYNMMEEFYHQIYNGRTKSVALAEAQRKIVNTPSFYNHPYYWGNLILSGSTEPLFKSNHKTYIWLGLAFGILLISGGFMIKRKRKVRNN